MEQKFIFIDLDGTLTPHSTWYELNMMLGITPEEDKALFERYLKNDLLYNDWTAELVRLHKEHDSVAKADFISLAQHIELRPDVLSIIQTVKQRGYRTILISGSVDVIVETIAQKLGFDDWLACTKAVFDDHNMFTNFVSSGDESPAKFDLAKRYCEAHGRDLSQAIVVGDGGNELDLFKITKGILLGNNEKLKPFAWKQIESFLDIPQILP